jgi:phage shock protein A
MFKSLITLMRGRAFEAERRLVDKNALAILDQQMRDASAAVDRTKKALAIAIAQDKQEEQRCVALRRQAEDLEQRALEALQGQRENLAQKAAEAIAALETDIAAAEKSRSLFGAEISKLERHARKQALRLADLERGRRVARAAEAVRVARRGRIEKAPPCQSTLNEVESTLARLRAQQAEAEAAEEALDGLDAEPAAETISEALAAEGFGAPSAPRVCDVLARIKAKAAGAVDLVHV